MAGIVALSVAIVLTSLVCTPKADGADLISIDGLELLPRLQLTFGDAPRPKLIGYEPTEEQKALSIETMDEEEKSLWERLLKGENWHIDAHMLLRRVAKLHQGENFNFEGIDPTLVDDMIGAHKLRLSDCSWESVESWNNQPPDQALANHKVLRAFMYFYRERRYRFCRRLFEIMLETKFKDVPQATANIADKIVRMNESSLDDADLNFNFEPDLVAKGMASFVWHTNSIRQALLKRIEKGYITPLEIQDSVLKHLRKLCYLIESATGEFVDYYDNVLRIHGTESQNLNRIPLSDHLRRLIVAGRLFRILLDSNRSIYWFMWRHICQIALLKITPKWDRENHELGLKIQRGEIAGPGDEPRSSQAGPSLTTWTLSDENFDAREAPGTKRIFSFSWKPIQFESFRIPRRQIGLLDRGAMTSNERYSWDQLFLTHQDFTANEVYQAMRKLQVRHRLDLEASLNGLSLYDIRELIDLEKFRLINCMAQNVIDRLTLVKNPHYRMSGRLNFYINYYGSRQDRTCWSIFEMMMDEGLSILRKETYELFHELKLSGWMSKLGANSELHHHIVAHSISQNESYEDLAELKIDQVQEMIDRKFKTHCFYVRELMDDFVDYLDEITKVHKDVPASIREVSHRWIEFDRVCRSIEEPDFAKRVRRILNMIESNPSYLDVQDSQFSIINDGLTFHVGPKTQLITKSTFMIDQEEILNLTKISDREFWHKITDPSVTPIRLYEALFNFRGRHNGHFSLNGITSTDVDILISIQPMRLANCLHDNMRDRSLLVLSPHLYKYSKISEYIQHYNERSNNVCWKVFNMIILSKLQELPETTKASMDYLQTQVRYNCPTKKLYLGLPCSIKRIVSAFTYFLARDSSFKQAIYSMDGAVSANDFYKILTRSHGAMCRQVNDVLGDTLEYFDESYTSEEIPKPDLGQATLTWMSNVRLCRALFSHRSYIEGVYHKFIRQGNLIPPLRYVDPFASPDADYWRHIIQKYDEQIAEDIRNGRTSSDHDPSIEAQEYIPFEKRPGMTFSEDSIPIPPDELNSEGAIEPHDHVKVMWDSLIGQNPISISEVRWTMQLLFESLKNSNVQYRNLGIEDLKYVLSLSNIRLVDCTTENMENRAKVLEHPRFRNLRNLVTYIEHTNTQQRLVCRRVLELILKSNISDIPTEVRTLMNELLALIQDKCDLPRPFYNALESRFCLVDAIAAFVLQSNDRKKMFLHYRVTLRNPRMFFIEIFGDACNLTMRATGDLIDYVDRIPATDPQPGQIVNERDTAWLSHGRLCRLLLDEDGRYAHKIFVELNRLLSLSESSSSSSSRPARV